MTFEAFIDLITKGGPTGVLLVVLWAMYTDRLVTGATYKRAIDERDEFLRQWTETLRLAGRAATVADKALKGPGDDRLRAQRQVRTGRRGDDDVS